MKTYKVTINLGSIKYEPIEAENQGQAEEEAWDWFWQTDSVLADIVENATVEIEELDLLAEPKRNA